MKRAKTAAATETRVLLNSRRRCCICFGLNRNTSLAVGQIAHLDRDASNSAEDNLAFLCLPHHDEYDSKTSQRKGLTIGEVKAFRDELIQTLSKAFSQQVHFGEIRVPPADPYAGKWVRIDSGVNSAEIIITPIPDAMEGYAGYFVSGLALWGAERPYGPNIGDLRFEGTMNDPGVMEWIRPNGDRNVVTTLRFDRDGFLRVEEENWLGEYGMNVTFGGAYRRSDGAV